MRDLRLRWALEEAGFPYEIASTPLETRDTQLLERQPFGQVPFLTDGDPRIFESGACLLHLARKTEVLMPADAEGEASTLEWVIAALNSVEMVSVPWWFLTFSSGPDNALADWLRRRLQQLEHVLQGRAWLAADRFTVADLLMAEVLRIPDVKAFAASSVLDSYVERVCDRPAFRKALADQLAHFQESDRRRKT